MRSGRRRRSVLCLIRLCVLNMLRYAWVDSFVCIRRANISLGGPQVHPFLQLLFLYTCYLIYRATQLPIRENHFEGRLPIFINQEPRKLDKGVFEHSHMIAEFSVIFDKKA